MKIGVLSDTHNNTANTQVALSAFRERGISKLIHCGDLTTPGVVHLFAGWDVQFVFGNMDRDQTDLIEAAKRIGAPPPQRSRDFDVDGVHIAFTHGDNFNLLYRLMFSGRYSFVCHGHTHERRDEMRGAYRVRLVNPGALGGSRPQSRSIAILDTDTQSVEFVEFPTLD